MMKVLITLVMGFFLWTVVNPVQTDEDNIRTLLEQRDSEIKKILGPKGSEYTPEQRNQLRDIVNGIIDFGVMAKEALGDTYHEISAEQREEFTSLFATIIRDNSLNRLDIYRADVVYNDITITDGLATVNTTAQLDNVRTPVDYTMEKKDGEWFITDMIIDNVSTVESYQRQFHSIIRQRGFDALLQSLQRRAARSST